MRLSFNVDNYENIFKEVDAFFAHPNAEACNEALGGLIESKSKGVVIKLYLEDFKSFNEMFGYQSGGLLLREIACFLCRLEHADVYRPAGVEFVVILNGLSRVAAFRAIDSIIARFEKSWSINGLDCMCSVNVGMAFCPGPAASPSELMDQLSYAVIESAKKGPNHYVVFEEELRHRLYRMNAIARMIPAAIENGRLELRYRPTFNTHRQIFTRADSYMRLISGEFGIIQQAEFIPIAEESGLIYMISQYAVNKACELIARLIRDGVEFETIAVPISPIQFQQERFLSDVKAALNTNNVPADKLGFEVSQSVALNAFPASRARMFELSEMGIEIIFTEFGTGYSGIVNIMHLPVDAVKLERMMTWQIDNDPKGSKFVGGLIQIAKNLEISVIAEGVETANQVAVLKEYGCDYQQGFYYSPTLTPGELEEALLRRDLEA
ncbi:MAG: bifunctional diguanylate cyclase/phosphodiesterase [Oscillospiraceae bacterium]|nr:bifunctional diguanylate cyclase/phosphodiesterase [Oscillospiraceae bacterium]